MNSFEIFVDSAANIPNGLCRERNINVVSFTYMVGGEERLCYEEGVPFRETAKRFYAEMRADADVKTSLIPAARFQDAVIPALESGKDVIIVTIASGISGTWAQAVQACERLKRRYPDRKLYVADSANASMGEGLLALRIADLRDMGESVESCYEWAIRNAYKINSYCLVEDLKYLRKGGRISRTLALAGSLLNIKPLLKADGGEHAKLTFFNKVRGRKKGIAALADYFTENAVRPEGQTVAITHCDCEEEANELAEELKARGAREVLVEYYDLCTGAHIGPGTIALFFFGKDRRAEAPEFAPVTFRKAAPERNKP